MIFLRLQEFKEIIYLYIVQIINQFFPVITMPLLIRNIGYADYGLISFAISFSNYLFLFSDYGFSLSAPKDIAMNKHNYEYINKYYYSVQLLRFILLFIVILISQLAFIFIPSYKVYYNICFIFILYSIGSIGFPTWFYQGMQILQSSSLMIAITKFLQFMLLYIYFMFDNSVMVVSYIYSFLNIFQFLIGHLYLKKKYNLHFSIFSKKLLVGMIKDGWYYFISQSATSLFSSANVLILGTLTSSKNVGIYSTAEKIVRAIVNLSGPFCKAVYPGSAKRFGQNFNKGYTFVKQISKIIIPSFGIIMIFTYLCSDYIAIFFADQSYQEVSQLIKIMSPIILSIVINNMCGTQIMLNVGMQKTLGKITLYTGIINIVLSIILVGMFGYIYMGYSVLISELFFMICTIVIVFNIINKNNSLNM